MLAPAGERPGQEWKEVIESHRRRPAGGWERAQVLRREGRNPGELEQGSAANCRHDSYADNYTTSHRSHKIRCAGGNRRGASSRCRGHLPLPASEAHNPLTGGGWCSISRQSLNVRRWPANSRPLAGAGRWRVVVVLTRCVALLFLHSSSCLGVFYGLKRRWRFRVAHEPPQRLQAGVRETRGDWWPCLDIARRLPTASNPRTAPIRRPDRYSHRSGEAPSST